MSDRTQRIAGLVHLVLDSRNGDPMTSDEIAEVCIPEWDEALPVDLYDVLAALLRLRMQGSVRAIPDGGTTRYTLATRENPC